MEKGDVSLSSIAAGLYRTHLLRDYLGSPGHWPQPPTPPPPLTAAALEFTQLGLSISSSGHDPLCLACASAGGPPGGGDRVQRRMIKNRESAALSRARKQAYAHELEMKVEEKEMLVKGNVPDRPVQRDRSAPP